MAYKKEEIIEFIEQELKDKNKKYLYSSPWVNYSGNVKGEGELYTEVVAGYLLAHRDFLENVKELKRELSYRVNHNIEKRKLVSTRREELFACSLRKSEKYSSFLSKVIDFQVPLKPAKVGYDGVGKIDLLSFAKADSEAYIIELKYEDNKDTLLKAILEVAYYYRWLWKEKFLTDFGKELSGIGKSDIKKAVLLGEGTKSLKEARELGKRPNLTRLIADLKVDIFSVDRNMSINSVSIEQ